MSLRQLPQGRHIGTQLCQLSIARTLSILHAGGN
jgi:hypothetical protein